MENPIVFGRPTVTYQTNAYGGVDADLNNTAAPLGTAAFVRSTSQPTAQGGVVNSERARGVSVKVKANSSGTTDNFKVDIQTSDDGSEWDTVAWDTFTIIATSGNDVIQTKVYEAPARYIRVVGQSTGATDTFDVEATITPYTEGHCTL